MRRLSEFDEEQVEVGGVPTRFLLTGQGRPMILLHADGDNRMDWRWVIGRLATQHRVYAPDLPGFGGTATPLDCSPEFYERFVRKFLDTCFSRSCWSARFRVGPIPPGGIPVVVAMWE
jgi:pimeloyl-ACP methyl ester carboxylesterase